MMAIIKMPFNKILVLFFVVVLLNLILVAVPGYRSHDELIIISSLTSLSDIFSSFHWSGGLFYRPVGLAIIRTGLLLGFEYPFIPHLLSVSAHGLFVVICYLVLLRYFDRNISLLTALLVSIIPTSMHAVGWVVGLYDVLLSLFIASSVLFYHKYLDARNGVYLVVSVLFVLASAGTKETWVIIPVYYFFLAYVNYEKRKPWLLYGVFISVLVVLYIYLRFDALFGSNNIASHYNEAGIYKVIDNIYSYSAFPFFFDASEVGILNIARISLFSLLSLVGFYSLYLYLSIKSTYCLKMAFVSIGLYFTYLIPVLIISGKGGQYLYGSGIGLGLLLAIIYFTGKLGKIVVSLAAAVLVLHSFNMQINFYDTAVCQNKSLLELQGGNMKSGHIGSDVVGVYSERGAPWWVAARVFHYINRVDRNANYEMVKDIKAADYLFTPECRFKKLVE